MGAVSVHAVTGDIIGDSIATNRWSDHRSSRVATSKAWRAAAWRCPRADGGRRGGDRDGRRALLGAVTAGVMRQSRQPSHRYDAGLSRTRHTVQWPSIQHAPGQAFIAVTAISYGDSNATTDGAITLLAGGDDEGLAGGADGVVRGRDGGRRWR
jgi:hypothetical protein